ncbi:cell division protein ZapA [uncultured Desulfosarcina sp.]|uniref:cell division protein ZapA n=1 Tax=uncultured Desulfosarcina sp. TaxID=218289 RepID=UPI0029C90591|nr:cell division protein ZapA [uncultured Desulfosarcina sp.]
MEQTITLQILGRKFTFQTESAAPDAKVVAARFEDAVNKVQSQFDEKLVNIDKETILILTGLNIASEHYKLEQNYRHFFSRMTEKSAVVLNELEKAMA